MKLRRATPYQVRAADKAAALLHDALLMARTANCPRLAQRIRFAIASADGARRHIRRRAVFGVLHPMQADRRAFEHVESPKRPLWFREGQYA